MFMLQSGTEMLTVRHKYLCMYQRKESLRAPRCYSFEESTQHVSLKIEEFSAE